MLVFVSLLMLQSCSTTSSDVNSSDVAVINNGGKVVEYKGVTYLTMLNEDTVDEEFDFSIYGIII